MTFWDGDWFISGEMTPDPVKRMLKGQVTVDAAGVGRKRILIVNRRTMEVLYATDSNPDGTWAIMGVQPYLGGELMIIAFDDTGKYNSETADHVSQELMHP